MSNTIRALENANRLVRNIPLDRAAQGLMAARTANETAEGDFQNKIRGLQMPGLELAANRDKRQLANETRQFNLKSVMDPSKITQDQALMLVQDQKDGLPPGIDRFRNNLKQVHGITLDDNWNAWKDNGKTPLPAAEAMPIFQELSGTLGLLTDPIKSRQFKVASLQDTLSSTQDPKEQQAIKAQIEKINAIPESKLLGQYIADLQTTIINHKDQGRNPTEAMARLDWAINQYNAAVGSESERSKREYETQKENDKRAFELKKLGIEEAGKDRRAKNKDGERDTRGSFQKDVEFYSQATGTPVNEAAERFRQDKTLAQRLRAASAEIEAFTNSMAGMNMDQEQMRALVDETYTKYGIGPVDEKQADEIPNDDPLGIR